MKEKRAKPSGWRLRVEAAVTLLGIGVGIIWTLVAIYLGATFMAPFGLSFVVAGIASYRSLRQDAKSPDRLSRSGGVASEGQVDPFASRGD